MTAACLPEISVERVPSEGLPSNGTLRRLFVKLWTIASCDYVDEKYFKSEWLELEQLLFTHRRTNEQRQALTDLVARLWATASEMPEYGEHDWRTLRSAIHLDR